MSAVRHLPTPGDVERIAALSDPVMRNLHITQSYHELARALADRLAPGANWCSFATWASKQAGQTIRKEDVARLLDDALQSAPAAQSLPELAAVAQSLGVPGGEADIQESLLQLLNPAAAFDRAAAAVARGNLKVFAEIGREFARFAATCLHDSAYDPASIERFCAALSPGDPPDGQRYLRQAFSRYYQARFEADPSARAQLMLLANIEIGLHEQTRLQPEIAAALDAAFIGRRLFRLRVIRALFPDQGWRARVRLLLLWLFDRPSPLDPLLDGLLAEARRRARLVITDCLMCISLPNDGRLRLGDDLGAAFPASLQQLTLADLLALLAAFDPTPDSTRDSGARDWAYLPDRLHFIIDLFRCYHARVDLFDPPFSADQCPALKAERLPAGRL